MVSQELVEIIGKGIEKGGGITSRNLMEVTREFRAQSAPDTHGILYWIAQLASEDDGLDLVEKSLALFEILNLNPFTERTNIDRFGSAYMAILLEGVGDISSIPASGSLEKIVFADLTNVELDSGVMRLPERPLSINAVVWKHDEEGFFGMRYTREAKDSLPLMIANSQPLTVFLNQR